MTRVLMLTGPKTCGKDTAAAHLLSLSYPRTSVSPFRKLQFAGAVKAFAMDMFGYSFDQMEDGTLKEAQTAEWPYLAPRWPLMDIANWMRDKYGPNVHACRARRIIMEHRGADDEPWAWVIPDLRFPDDELPIIRGLDAETLVVYIHRDKAEESLTSAKLKGDAMALNPSEAYYAKLREEADVVLTNEEGKPWELKNKIVSYVRNEWGYWYGG